MEKERWSKTGEELKEERDWMEKMERSGSEEREGKGKKNSTKVRRREGEARRKESRDK